MPDDRTTGTIVSYDPEEGEGDIRPDGEDDEVPFYEESLSDPSLKKRLHEGDRVRFGITGGMTGMMCTDVERIDD